MYYFILYKYTTFIFVFAKYTTKNCSKLGISFDKDVKARISWIDYDPKFECQIHKVQAQTFRIKT